MQFTTILCHSQKSPSNQETPQNQVFLIFSINYIKYLSSMGDMFILLPEPLDLSAFAPLLEVLLHGFCTVFLIFSLSVVLFIFILCCILFNLGNIFFFVCFYKFIELIRNIFFLQMRIIVCHIYA